MQLLTRLGMDTGFKDFREGVIESCNAGMEILPSTPGSPYIVKSPYLCELLFDDLKAGRIIVDHAFIPIRKLRDAAASRVAIQARMKDAEQAHWFGIPGGLWGTQNPKMQGAALAKQFYRLMYTLTVFDVPHTLIEFPRLAFDPNYLYTKLAPVLEHVEYAVFLDAFQDVVKTSLIHDFQKKNSE